MELFSNCGWGWGVYPVAFLLRYSRSQYCSLLPSSATGAPGGGLPSQRESTGPACFWPPAQPQGLPVSILAVVWPLGSPAILVFCVLVSTHSGPGLLSPEGQERATKPSHLLSPPPSLPKSLSVLPERGLSCPKQTLSGPPGNGLVQGLRAGGPSGRWAQEIGRAHV